MAAKNRSGLLLAEPAIMKFQFIRPPNTAAIPTNAPITSATPIANSPMATSLANHTYDPESSSPCRKLRYQSNVMAGLAGAAGIATALLQKPLSAAPVSIHAGLLSL